MTVMPRFLYLFQMIPIFLPKSYFTKLEPACIKKASLERVISDGGLGLPHFLFYYWAEHIVKLTYWITMFAYKEVPIWADMGLRAPSFPDFNLNCPLPLNIKSPEMNSKLVVQNF